MFVTSICNNSYIPQINFQGIKVTPTTKQWNDLKVFSHHIYEYKKGLRSLILTTEKEANRQVIVDRLQRENISYLIQNVDEKK